MRKALIIWVLVAMTAAACSSSSETETTPTTPPDTTTQATAAPGTAGTTPGTAPTTTSATTPTTRPEASAVPAMLRKVPAFGVLAANPLLGSDPEYGGPATPRLLDGVLWGDETYRSPLLDEEAIGLLLRNGFVVVDGGFQQFHQAYSRGWFDQPLFVTTDAAYHYWHLVFAKALQDTEQYVLLPVLDEFADRLAAAAAAEIQRNADAAMEVSAALDRVAAFSELLLVLLGRAPAPPSPAVAAEVQLIEEHLAFTESPTSGAVVDYTLFRPRGHYTRNEDLTRYFLAMSALGHTAFRLSERDQVRTAAAMSQVLTSDPQLEPLWRKVYEPTAFLVGLADDYTPFEVATIVAGLGGFGAFEDPAAVAELTSALLALRQVAIDPELSSVRVMGARFVLDSYIIDQLVYPNLRSRLTASPLDVAAAFGSTWAYEQLVQMGETADPQYDPQLEAMRSLVEGRGPDDWAGTVYDAWLYALQPSWVVHGSAYPDFMRTDAWTAKAHQAGFGSYTELKHDTVLYAKQAFAEGEGPPPPPAEPRHWVEPDPVVFARLAAVAGLMEQGLADRGLLDEDVATLLDQLIDMYQRFERLAADELAGLPISNEDNDWLERIGSRFELLWLLTAEEGDAVPGGFPESPDDAAALVVDIMSNPDMALEIATGLIDHILVLVPNDDGVFQIAEGGVYSYYEFWVPRGERMTDEEWRAMVTDWQRRSELPDRPAWTDSFLVGR